MNVLLFGATGLILSTIKKIKKRQKRLEKNGVTVLQNLVKWLVRKSAQIPGIMVYRSNIY